MEPRAAERSKVTHFPATLLILGWLLVCDVVLAETILPDNHDVKAISSNSTNINSTDTTTVTPGKTENLSANTNTPQVSVTWTRVVTSISVEYVTTRSVATVQLDNVTNGHGQSAETVSPKDLNKKQDVVSATENTSVVVVVELREWQGQETDDGSNGTKEGVVVGSLQSSSPSAGSQVREEEPQLAPGAIAGIVIAAVVFTVIVAALFLYVMYERSTWLGSKNYNSKLSNGSSSYLEDSTQVSYINYNVDIAKDPCEEMSLDNDSFLNSLEAITMKNYWADDCKNTKV